MLFELLVVMAILLTCCTLAFISYGPLKSASFASDAALISLLFHTAATRAVSVKKEQELIINELDATLFFDNQKYQLHEPFRFGILPDVYGPPSAPTRLVASPISFTGKKATFYKDGTMQSGTLYITDSSTQYALTVPVSAFAHIRAYRYNNKKWQQLL